MRSIITIATAAMLSGLVSLPANAQQMIANYDNWRVFTVEREGKKVCYIASLPTKKDGNYSKRSDPYLLVTHKGGAVDEVSTSSGYPYKEGEEVTLSFGQKRFPLFVKGEIAWAYDEASDKSIVKEMIRGNDVKIKGTSWKNTKSTDTYSLKGFTAAHRHMKRECK